MIKQVTIQGKEYPIRFGLSVIMQFSRKMNFVKVNDFQNFVESLDEDLTFDQMEAIAILLQMAVKRGCEEENIPFELSVNQMVDLFIEDREAITQMMQALTESFFTGAATDAAKKKVKQKKLPGLK